MRAASALLLAVALAACATKHEPAVAPSFQLAAGAPAPAQARFYADCIAQAAGANTFDREANTIRFHCTGAPAQRFFDGLAAYSTQIGSERSGEGRTWRYSAVVTHDPSGLDFCWRRDPPNDGEYGCTVVLNAGEYLAAPN